MFYLFPAASCHTILPGQHTHEPGLRQRRCWRHHEASGPQAPGAGPGLQPGLQGDPNSTGILDRHEGMCTEVLRFQKNEIYYIKQYQILWFC